MRVVVLGGTNFIGRRITEDLHARGDEVTVVHRGVTEPSGWLDCHHVHAARADFGRVAADVRALHPDAIIDTRAMTRADVEAVLAPPTPAVVLSAWTVPRLRAAGQCRGDRARADQRRLPAPAWPLPAPRPW